MDELKQILDQSKEEIKQHISHEFRQHGLDSSEKEYQRRYLESLWFPEINAREEGIKEAHKSTYLWIFQAAEDSALRWSDFNQWLRSGNGVYWISGKAGSGKSTLMRYVCDSGRTRPYLKAWSAPMQCMMVTYFFWNPGTEMQKTFVGLYRSLLHQILSQIPHLILIIESRNRHMDFNSRLIATWTDARLKTLLFTAIEEVSKSHNLCFLIDGLDELTEDHEDLVAFIRNILLFERIKVCLSSRPLRIFRDAFGSSPMLRLEDLTKNDIRTYVRASLEKETSQQISGLAEDIVRRAEGVFLWASLVTREVRRGLANEDSLDTLRKRIDSLPTEIEGLYTHMLKKIDHVHRNMAARCFKSALEPSFQRFDLMGLSLALHEEQDNSPLGFFKLTLEETLGLCQQSKRRLPTICAGMLEINEVDCETFDSEKNRDNIRSHFSWQFADPGVDLKESSTQTWEFLRLLHTTRVDWIHRTAFEFLWTSKKAEKFLETNTPSSFCVETLRLKTRIAACRLIGPVTANYFRGDGFTLSYIMCAAYSAERRAGVPQVILCDYVIQAMKTIYNRNRAHIRVLQGLDIPMSPRAEILSALGSESVICRAESADSPMDYSPFWSTDDLDLLCYAAYHGALLYVKARINADSNLLSEGFAATRLLACSLAGLEKNVQDAISSPCDPLLITAERLGLLFELLNRGANPNVDAIKDRSLIGCDTTVWGRFLECMGLIYVGCLRQTQPFKTWQCWKLESREYRCLGQDHQDIPRLRRLCSADLQSSTNKVLSA